MARIHLQHKEYFVGGFLLVATLALLGLLLATLAKNDVFADSYHLRMVLPSKSDLAVGAKVKIRGMKVGMVTELGFNQDGLIEIVLQIETKYQAMIRENSEASLIQERFPISDRIVDITQGIEPARILEDNMTLRVKPPLDLDAVMQKALSALDNLTQIVARINRGEGTVGAILTRNELYDQINVIAGKGIRTMDNANGLLTQLNGVAGKANSLIDSLRPAIDSASVSAQDLPAIMKSVQTLLDTVNVLVSGIKAMTGDVAPLLNKGEGLLNDAGDVMGAAKNTWPLSGKVPTETEDPPVFIETPK